MKKYNWKRLRHLCVLPVFAIALVAGLSELDYDTLFGWALFVQRGQADVQLRSVSAQVIGLSDLLFLGYPHLSM